MTHFDECYVNYVSSLLFILLTIFLKFHVIMDNFSKFSMIFEVFIILDNSHILIPAFKVNEYCNIQKLLAILHHIYHKLLPMFFFTVTLTVNIHSISMFLQGYSSILHINFLPCFLLGFRGDSENIFVYIERYLSFDAWSA